MKSPRNSASPRRPRVKPKPIERPVAAGRDRRTAEVAAAGTLDRLTRELFQLSWAEARAAVRTGKISLTEGDDPNGGGRIETAIEYRVKAGTTLAFHPSAPRLHVRRRVLLEQDAIVHLDSAIVVVNKPAGISTVPFGDETGTEALETLDALVRDILAKRIEERGRARGRAPLGIVHRIDKDTSGVLVFSRTLAAKQDLSNQFRKHTTDRRYMAIVHGIFTGTRTYKSYLVENRGDGLRGSARPGMKEGQLAITHVTAIQSLLGATLVSCVLETGRTHQIRIHLSEDNHPLVGEAVYIRRYPGERIEAPRMMLHAADLGFEHPTTGEHVEFSVPPPPDFLEVMRRLHLPPRRAE